MGIAKCQLLSNAHLRIVVEANHYAKFHAFCRNKAISDPGRIKAQNLFSKGQLQDQHLKTFKINPVASGKLFHPNRNVGLRRPKCVQASQIFGTNN